MSGGVKKKFQMTNIIILNNIPFKKHAEKSVPGLADVGVALGDGDGVPELHPDVWRGQEKISNDQSYYS